MRNLCLVIFVLILQLQGQTTNRRSYTFSRQDAFNLAKQLMENCGLENPDNTYFPDLVREKINWLYGETNAGRISMSYTEDAKNELGSVLMYSGYRDGKPYVEISLRWLILWVRVDGKMQSGFNRMQKNSFALSLTHEAVHLERPQSSFIGKKTRKQFIAEEFRTYRKVDLAVVELLKKNEPVGADFVEVHNVLVKCGKTPTCPAFIEFYERNNRDNSMLPK